MGVIRVMPEALANQIAAGEVVERPASCIKELVENSLDAGAKHILISIVEGGISSMVVQDDGHGMDPEDVVLAFERHATSKVGHARDLLSLSTLGFRGEALASIAAVAKVTLSSRQSTATEGVQYGIEGTDSRRGPISVGMPQGTRVEVQDLFFNTPARLKYLKSVATEQSRCIEAVQRVAVGRPDVAFTCQVNDTVVFRTDGRGDVRTVLAALYGVGEARQFLMVGADSSDYRVRGLVGRPTQSRSNRAHGYLYINGRAIRNLAVHQAVVAAFGSRLMVNRHPMYAISIDMDPKLVDVNIHPHKAEVRFSEERDVTTLVERAVREALDEAFLVSEAGASALFKPSIPVNRSTGERPPTPWATSRRSGPAAESRPLFETALPKHVQTPVTSDALRSVLAPTPTLSTAGGGVDESRDEVAATQVAERSAGTRETYVATVSSSDAEAAGPESSEGVPDADMDVQLRPSQWHLRAVGQALGMYVIADDGESLYIIDQHAAHEKILYERFRTSMAAKEVGRIPLLTPVVIHLTASERAEVEPYLSQLAELGLESEPFGGADLVVRTVPTIWEGLDIAGLATTFLTELANGSAVDARNALSEALIMRACKAAIKANHHLSGAEMEALCQALSDLDDPFHCPHGRPILIRMTSRDLEKGFKRIV